MDAATGDCGATPDDPIRRGSVWQVTARCRSRTSSVRGHRPCHHHRHAAGRGMAIADPDGMAPGRPLHAALGGLAVVPGELAERARARPRPAARPCSRRHNPRRPARHRLVSRRGGRPAEHARPALHHTRPTGLAGQVRRCHRLDGELPPDQAPRRPDAAARAGPRAGSTLVAGGCLHRRDHPG
jgi:hypothetical protein